MDNELKRVLELAGVKEARGDLSYGSKNDPSIKRENGQTLMINPDGEDEWVGSEYEEDAIDSGYYYSTSADAERYEQDRMDRARSKTASMFEDGAEVTAQEALADKVAVIIDKLTELYPPDTYDNTHKIKRLGGNYLDDPEVDVAFSTIIGIPVVNTSSITRHAATRDEPEDVDSIEEESVINMEIVISTVVNNTQFITLFDDEGNDYESVEASADTNEIIKTFASVIDDTKLGAKAEEGQHFSSYKQFRDYLKAQEYDGPDDRD